MANMGQVCCAGSRTYVQDTIYDEFVKKSVEAAKKRTVGNPLDGKNENGAQVSNLFSLSMKDVFITENFNNNTINNNNDNNNSNSRGKWGKMKRNFSSVSQGVYTFCKSKSNFLL